MAGPAPTPPAWAEAAARVAAARAGETVAGGEQGKGRAGQGGPNWLAGGPGRGGTRQALAAGGSLTVITSGARRPREPEARARGAPGTSRGRLSLPSRLVHTHNPCGSPQ